MSDDCSDEYEDWLQLNEDLEELRDKAASMNGWEGAWKQYARDMGNGNLSDAFDHAVAANQLQWDQTQVSWEADRLQNGAWGDAVDALWDCIHDYGS